MIMKFTFPLTAPRKHNNTLMILLQHSKLTHDFKKLDDINNNDI